MILRVKIKGFFKKNSVMLKCGFKRPETVILRVKIEETKSK